MSAPARVLLVGAGAIATAYAEVIGRSDAVDAAAVVDVDPRAAARLAAALGVDAFPDVATAIAACRADFALVCTPPVTHAALCLELLDRGLPVLCEKPFALSSLDAASVLDTAARAGVPVSMAAKFRSVGDVAAARGLVDDGAIGTLVRFENVFASRVDMTTRWNADPAVSGGGVLIDNGTHSVDLARLFLGPIDAVLATTGPRLQAVEVEDNASLALRAGDALGTIDLSWSVDHGLDHYVRLVGTSGQLEIGWRRSRHREGSGGWVSFGTGYRKHDALAGEVEGFARVVRNGGAPPVGRDDVLASVDVIAAAYRALRRGEWQTIPHRMRVVSDGDVA